MKTSKEARDFLNKFRSLVEFANAVDEAQKLEDAISSIKIEHERMMNERTENLKQRTLLNEQLKRKREELDKLNADVANLEGISANMQAEIEKQGQGILDTIVADAKQRAKGLIDDALAEQDKIKSMTKQLQQKLRDEQKKYDTLYEKFSDLRKKLSAVA